MIINTGRKSAMVMKVKINKFEKTFDFPEKTNTDSIKNYILKSANDYKLPINEKEIYYMGNKLISNDTNYNSISDIDNYFIFLSRIQNDLKFQEPEKKSHR